MAGNLEQLVLEILLKDRASEGLGRTSRAASLAGDSVGTLNKKLEETGRKAARARVELAGDKQAQASLDKMDARLISLDRRVASPHLKVEGAARALAELSSIDLELDRVGGKGGTAEAATSALGAGGLAGPGGMGALIGAGVALSPVIATLGVGLGGLGLAAYSVTKNTALMAKELAPLKSEFHSFSASLQPEVLSVFNKGVGIAGHLLHDIQPVAAATGKAFGGFLGQVDKELQGGQWQGFFRFMAAEAGPDIKLVGDNFVSLMHVLPPLLEGLQPVAEAFLKITNAGLGAIGMTEELVRKVRASGGGQPTIWDEIKGGMSWVEKHTPAGHKSLGQLLEDWLGMGNAAGTAGGKVKGAGNASGAAALKVQTLAQQVNALTAAENKSLSPLLAYTNALLTQTTDAKNLNDALKASRNRIGLKTDAERASFSAANTYIQDLLNTASAAYKSHQNLDQVIASLKAELPRLQGASSNTKGYWQQVQYLTGWLQKLELLKPINETVRVFGSGQWQTAGIQGIPPGVRAPGLAAGWRVPGYGGGDRWPALLEGGEAVVDKATTAAHAAELRAWGVPGFASGGIIPAYGGPVRGLPPWGQHNLNATIAQIVSAVARAMARQLAGTFGGGPGGGALGGGPAANRALAMRMFPWPMSMWAAFDYLEMREAGYNRFARNPSSGAYGIPQALPPTKMPFAAQAGGGSHAGAQLSWMHGYIRSVYGNPVNAAAHERGFNWYGGGLDAIVSTPTLIGVGERGPERVTVTPAGRGGAGVVINNLTVHVHAPSGNATDIGRTLARYLGQFIKSGGRIYPAGTAPR